MKSTSLLAALTLRFACTAALPSILVKSIEELAAPRKVLHSLMQAANPTAAGQRTALHAGGLSSVVAMINPLSHLQRAIFPMQQSYESAVGAYERPRESMLYKLDSANDASTVQPEIHADLLKRYFVFEPMTLLMYEMKNEA